MRVFIGIWFPDDKKEQLKAVMQNVKQNSMKGNFTSVGNFHLTLRFIGEADANQIRKLQKAIDSAAALHRPFSFVIEGLDQFRRQNESIVYADIRKTEELHYLYADLERELAQNGFEREKRPYTPHVTIGREVVLNREFDLEKESFDNIIIEAGSISLIQSTQIKGALTYIPIYTKPLNRE